MECLNHKDDFVLWIRLNSTVSNLFENIYLKNNQIWIQVQISKFKYSILCTEV